MKPIVATLILVLLTGAGCSALPSSDEARVRSDAEVDGSVDASSDRAASGTVTSVNLDAIAADGPAVVAIRTEAGTPETINVPSFGINLCAASASIADVYALRSGDRVEVNGSVSEDGAIVPCESSAHYLRVVGE